MFNSTYREFAEKRVLRDAQTVDEAIEAAEAELHPLFEAMLITPAPSILALAQKTEAIIDEYGEADAIPTRMVRVVLRDVKGMAAS